MSFQYIRDYYGVPAKRGEPVLYKGICGLGAGKRGVVTSARGQYVRVRLDGSKRSLIFHPSDLVWVNRVED